MKQTSNRTGVIIKTPFEGQIETSFVDADVAYSKLSLNDYLAQEDNLKAISWDEFHKLHSEYFYQPFRQITESEFDIAFTELPPKRSQWLTARFCIFFCPEALSGVFHALYVYDAKDEKCYAGTKSILLSDQEIIAGIEAEIINPEKPNNP